MTEIRITFRLSKEYVDWLPDALKKESDKKKWARNKFIQEVLAEKLKEHKPKPSL